jgi:cytochrome c553
MKLTRQEAPLSMGWCVECHRNPGPNLSPPGAIFSPFDPETAGDTVLAHARLEEYGIDTSGLTDCSTCHR